jgi:hypothetical protein
MRHPSLDDRFDPATRIVDYDPAWPDLALRDYLRVRAEEAAGYGEVKRRLAALRPGDRLAYIEGKADYVAALEKRAVMFARGREKP